METKVMKFFDVLVSSNFWRDEHFNVSVVANNTREARRIAVSVCVAQGFLNKAEIRKTDVNEKIYQVFLSA